MACEKNITSGFELDCTSIPTKGIVQSVTIMNTSDIDKGATVFNVTNEEIIESLLTHWDVPGSENLGYDAKGEEFVDMFNSGIIDPKKVTRTAIENAASVVSMILTTECMVVNKPVEKPQFPMIPPMV